MSEILKAGEQGCPGCHKLEGILDEALGALIGARDVCEMLTGNSAEEMDRIIADIQSFLGGEDDADGVEAIRSYVKILEHRNSVRGRETGNDVCAGVFNFIDKRRWSEWHQTIVSKVHAIKRYVVYLKGRHNEYAHKSGVETCDHILSFIEEAKWRKNDVERN